MRAAGPIHSDGGSVTGSSKAASPSTPGSPRTDCETPVPAGERAAEDVGAPMDNAPFATDVLAVLFEKQAAATPDEPAVIAGEETLTYAELDTRADRLAPYLVSRGVGAECVVAVVLGRSPELVVAILAVTKAGAAYCPIDPGYPA